MISIAKDFSKTPGPRYKVEGEFSGEEFRDRLLVPKFLEARRNNRILKVDLDGCHGYTTGFLEEAFGGLARMYWSCDVGDIIQIKSRDDLPLIEMIRGFFYEALKNKDAGKLSICKVKQNKDFYISLESDTTIPVGSMLSVEYQDKNYYFEVVEIETIEFYQVDVTAKEIGYYNLFRKTNVEIKDLIGLEVKIVTDKELIKKITMESHYL